MFVICFWIAWTFFKYSATVLSWPSGTSLTMWRQSEETVRSLHCIDKVRTEDPNPLVDMVRKKLKANSLILQLIYCRINVISSRVLDFVLLSHLLMTFGRLLPILPIIIELALNIWHVLLSLHSTKPRLVTKSGWPSITHLLGQSRVINRQRCQVGRRVDLWYSVRVRSLNT